MDAKLRIMVVDDEQDIAAMLKTGLEKSGFNAVAYTKPTQALQDLREHPESFGVVLSDIRMPEMTGFELARKSKAINPNVKVILISAFDVNMKEFSEVLPSTAPAVDDFIQKPARLDHLKQVLLEHIGDTK